jgi:hypothetical protein
MENIRYNSWESEMEASDQEETSLWKGFAALFMLMAILPVLFLHAVLTGSLPTFDAKNNGGAKGNKRKQVLSDRMVPPRFAMKYDPKQSLNGNSNAISCELAETPRLMN